MLFVLNMCNISRNIDKIINNLYLINYFTQKIKLNFLNNFIILLLRYKSD